MAQLAEVKGKPGAIDLPQPGQGLSTFRIQVKGTTDPVILSAPRDVIKALLGGLDEEKEVTLTISQ